MKIDISKTGGYAGIEEELLSLNTSSLEKDVSMNIENEIRNIRFFDLPEYIPSGAAGSDLYVYNITVSDDSKHHQVHLIDDKSPESQRYLEFFENLMLRLRSATSFDSAL